jgi:dCMP deaminase
MTCKSCGDIEPGKLIPVTDDGKCLECGESILYVIDDRLCPGNQKWDTYFHSVCTTIATNSPCLSRKIGAILVRDNSIISTGYNGPARGIPHCGAPRFLADDSLKQLPYLIETNELYSQTEINNTCPRKLLGFDSGRGMEYCTAQHAEENCISNAARNGVSVLGSILYMNCVIPCKNCFSTLINAGITEIVVDDVEFYDIHTKFIADNSSIKIRSFNI